MPPCAPDAGHEATRFDDIFFLGFSLALGHSFLANLLFLSFGMRMFTCSCMLEVCNCLFDSYGGSWLRACSGFQKRFWTFGTVLGLLKLQKLLRLN